VQSLAVDSSSLYLVFEITSITDVNSGCHVRAQRDEHVTEQHPQPGIVC
jgi:hypothetical protein